LLNINVLDATMIQSSSDPTIPRLKLVRFLPVLLWGLSLLSIGKAASAAQPVDIGTRRELFVDDALVERLAGQAQLRLHHPTPREIVLVHDAPWEGNATAYHNIFHDGQRYRMYYSALHLAVGTGQASGQLVSGPESLCHAESDDGIHWRKPSLGLHEFQGSKDNNIVLSAAAAERLQVRIRGAAVFLDANPAAPPAARYKMLLTAHSPLGMRPFQSADGIHWSPMSDGPTITDGAFDAQNLAFWDAARGEYRAYWRYFTEGVTNDKVWEPAGVRAIRTARSKDLLRWEDQADLAYVDSPVEQLYENGVAPYHRAQHLLIGYPIRYVDRAGAPSASASDGGDRAGPDRTLRWPVSLRALPDSEHRAARGALSERFGSALSEGLLMASRDGVTFKRWNEAFLRPGIERPGTWNYGHLFTAWSPVETDSALPGAPRELSFHAIEGYWTATHTSLRRYTLRLDGFVSLHAPWSGGELVTRPVVFSGDRLSLNFSSSAAGGLRVELQTAEGDPLAGFTLDECDELFGDTLDRTVSWNGRSDLSALAGTPLRLRFALRDADLFGFQFHGATTND
jgi:hypothetical protein